MIDIKVAAIFIVVALISLVDLGMNVFSLIPIIGDLLETAGELVLESLQLMLVALALYVAESDK